MTTGQMIYPFDANMSLHDGSALTATGVGSVAYIDTGDATSRFPGVAVINITVSDFTTGNETYDHVIEGSADTAFTTPVQLGSITTLGGALGRCTIPFDNVQLGVQYRYIRYKPILGGTTPILNGTVFVAPLYEVAA